MIQERRALVEKLRPLVEGESEDDEDDEDDEDGAA
jgi:hypothetical protein